MIDAHEDDRAASLIVDHAWHYIFRGRYATVESWISRLAHNRDADVGLLLHGAQAALYRGQIDTGRQWLERAMVEPDRLSAAERLLAYSAEKIFDRSIAIARQGSNQSPTVAALGMKALHGYIYEDEAASRALTERAFSTAAKAGLPANAIHMIPAQIAQVLHGSEAQVREANDQLRRAIENLYTPYGVAQIHNIQAQYWLANDDHEAAERALIAARDLLDEVKQPSGLCERYYELISSQLRGSTTAADPVPGPQTLTDRELQVLRAFDSNLTQREIGRELFLSFNTIKTYARSAYRKLGVGSRAEAVRACRRAGLF